MGPVALLLRLLLPRQHRKNDITQGALREREGTAPANVETGILDPQVRCDFWLGCAVSGLFGGDGGDSQEARLFTTATAVAQ